MPHEITRATSDATPADAAAAVFCPGCGYDLRSATSDRCSECGLVVDRSAAAATAVPWAHRRSIGRVRAFGRTVWAVTADRQAIRHELVRPQDPRDARRFRWCSAACLAVALLAVPAVAWATHGLTEWAVKPSLTVGFGGSGVRFPGYAQDLLVPWSAGATLLPLIPIYLIGLAVYVTGVGPAALRLRAYPPEHRERAASMALYAAAPLAWLLPAAALYAARLGVQRFVRSLRGGSQWRGLVEFLSPVQSLLWWTAAALAVAGVALTVHRAGEWHTRAHHAGTGRYTAGAAEVSARLLVGTVAFLGVAPWCAGLIWIILDSFRG